METYGKILLIAMPVFLAFVLLEKWYGWYKGKDTIRQMDMISSLSSGITNVTKDVLGLSLIIISYEWIVGRVALFHIQPGIGVYIIAFIALDFAGYWVHREQRASSLAGWLLCCWLCLPANVLALWRWLLGLRICPT